MANQKITPNTDREELVDLDVIIEQQKLHDKLQHILDSDDKELIAALLVFLGSLEDSLQKKEGGVE